MKKTRRFVTAILALLFVLVLSNGLFAADTVNVSIYGYDKAYVVNMQVPMEKFDVAPYNSGTSPDFFTPLHAFYYALDQGTELDLTNKEDFTCKGGYISKIDGLSEFDAGKDSGWMYTVNTKKPTYGVAQYPLQAGDTVVLYYSGGMTSPYAYFTPGAKSIARGNSVTFNLRGNYGDLDELYLKNIAGIPIKINGEGTDYKTDTSGNVTIPFNEVGTFTVSAESYVKNDDGLITNINYTAAVITVVAPVEGPDTYLKGLSISPSGDTLGALSPAFSSTQFQYSLDFETSSSNRYLKFVCEKTNSAASITAYVRPSVSAFEKAITAESNGSFSIQNMLTVGANVVRIHVAAPDGVYVLDRDYTIVINVTKKPSANGEFTARFFNPIDGLISIATSSMKYSNSDGRTYPANQQYYREAYGDFYVERYPNFIYSNVDENSEKLAGTTSNPTPLNGILDAIMLADSQGLLGSNSYTVTDLKMLNIGSYANDADGNWMYSIDGVAQTEKEAGEVNDALQNGSVVDFYYQPTGKTAAEISAPKSRLEANETGEFTVKDKSGAVVTGATIYVDGNATTFVTDANGKAQVSIAAKGKHTVTAKKLVETNDTLSCAAVSVNVGASTDMLGISFDSEGITKALNPVFNPDTLEYTLTVNYDTSYAFQGKPVLADPNAQVYCYYTNSQGAPIYAQWVPDAYSGYLDIKSLTNYLYPYDDDLTQGYSIGNNPCRIVVYSPDLQTTKEYKINVVREKSADPKLAALSVAGAKSAVLDENGVRFSADNASRTYTVAVNYETTQAAITATGKDANVNISGNTDLQEGDNTFIIKTISQDRKNRDQYTLIITRNPLVDITSASITPGYRQKTDVTDKDGYLNFEVPYDTASFDLTLNLTEGATFKVDNQYYFSGDSIHVDFPVTKNHLVRTDDEMQKIVTLTKEEDGRTVTVSRTINISRLGKKDVVPDEVISFSPAPGQFVSSAGAAGSAYAMLRSFINNDNLVNYVSLGTFGGYATYYYKNPIKNADTHNYGIDFTVYGNAFPGNPEPGGVMVAQDKDKDGKPDTDTNGKEIWYTLAGSSHYEDNTIWDYAVTYLNPKFYTGDDYLNGWYDNQGQNGNIKSDIVVKGYPDPFTNEIWETGYAEDQYTLSGTLLQGAANIDFGYFDVHSHTKNTGTYADSVLADGFDTPINPYTGLKMAYNVTKGDGMDISWAVDSEGNPVQLDEISFVKAYNCIFEFRGSLGEASPELGGIIRTKDTASVGVTEDLKSIKVQPDEGEAFDIPVKAGQYIYEINDMPATFTLDLGTDAENIYVNANRLAEGVTTSQEFSLKEDGSRLVRVIAQTGAKEPVIYLLRFQPEAPAVPAALSGLTLTADNGSVEGFAFDAGKTSYTATVTADATKIAVAPTAEDGNTIKVNDSEVAGGGSVDVALADSGDTTITVAVAKGDTTATYTITVKKAGSEPEPTPVESADWPNFRGNDVNMAVVDYETAKTSDDVTLKWSQKLRENDKDVISSVPIIADNSLIVMGGSALFKLDLGTGEVKDSAAMAGSFNWGYTPPTYGDGKIFVPLGGGKIQAFDAETLDSLWLYTDPLGDQALTPITYKDGYIYTGFWVSEVGDANYVCLSTADEDTAKSDEVKEATWTYQSKGGFYWAGAYIQGDKIYFGTDDGQSGADNDARLLCLNRQNGEEIDSLTLVEAGDQRSSIAFADGKLYFTTKNGYIFAVPLADDGTFAAANVVSRQYEYLQSTSTPVVYNGRVYFGIGVMGAPDCKLVVADANTLEQIYAAPMVGYPQNSVLLSTAYEASTGKVYIYSTYNSKPGGITVLEDSAGQTEPVVSELFTPESSRQQYCIASLVAASDGTMYYRNDTGYLFAVGNKNGSRTPESKVKISIDGKTMTVKMPDGTEITAADVDAMLSKAEGVTAIVLVPQTGGADNVTIAKADLARLGETGAAITVKTANGDVLLANAGVKAAANAGGGPVKIAVTQADGNYTAAVQAGDTVLASIEGGLTLTLPVSDSKVVAVVVNDDGSESVVQKSFAANGSIRIPLAGSAVVRLKAVSSNFTDIDNHWGKDSIQFAAVRELFLGTTPTTFSPDITMTRAMLVTVLYRLEKEPAAAGGSFGDVKAGSYYEKAVVWASANGIVNGVTPDKFEPDRAITRQELVTMISRYADHIGAMLSGTPAVPISAYSDYDQISDYAKTAMEWAYNGGLIQGRSDSVLAPTGTATRAEVATILQRFIEKTM